VLARQLYGAGFQKGLKMTKAKSERKKTHHQTHHGATKQARVVALLSKPSGTTVAAIMKATGWLPHTVRGFFAAAVRKRLGLKLESEKTDGKRIYRIVASKAKAKGADRKAA
jgi:hypothetical protein